VVYKLPDDAVDFISSFYEAHVHKQSRTLRNPEDVLDGLRQAAYQLLIYCDDRKHMHLVGISVFKACAKQQQQHLLRKISRRFYENIPNAHRTLFMLGQ
jgi:hypothetical protein